MKKTIIFFLLIIFNFFLISIIIFNIKLYQNFDIKNNSNFLTSLDNKYLIFEAKIGNCVAINYYINKKIELSLLEHDDNDLIFLSKCSNFFNDNKFFDEFNKENLNSFSNESLFLEYSIKWFNYLNKENLKKIIIKYKFNDKTWILLGFKK